MASRVTLEQMARACGLHGKKSRDSAAAWERGQSVPRGRYRPKFIDYLGNTLGLRHDPAKFHEVWDILVEVWDWDPVDDAEWREHFPDPAASRTPEPTVTSTTALPTLAEAHAILARMPTHGKVPSPSPLPVGSRMPLHRNRFFAGRETELIAIARALSDDGGVAVYQVETAAMTGLGGIGKTQLASEFVHRYGQYFAGGVFWLSFADPTGIPSEIAACGGHGYLALRPDFNELKLDGQVELVLAEWRKPLPRLLVFDNCEHEELLARWRPTNGGCVVIVTSQRSLWAPTLGVQALSLDVLDRATSVMLLRKYLGTIDATSEVLTAIAEELGDLPLALHLAGQYLARYAFEVTPEAYLAQLRVVDPVRHASLQSGVLSPTGHIEHVERTFEISLARLDVAVAVDLQSRRLLARAAYFAPGDLIPRDLLLSTLKEGNAATENFLPEDALNRLIELGFVEEAHEGTLRLHRLVVQWVLNALGDDEAQAAVERAVLNAAGPLAEAYDYTLMVQIQPLLRFVTDRALVRTDDSSAALATMLGHHLWLLADSRTAQAYLHRALRIREELAEPEPLNIAATLNILALVEQIEVNPSAALTFAQRALAIWESFLGPDHPSTDAEVNNIGYLHMLNGDYAQAEVAFRRSLKTRHHIYGVRDRETARVVHNLGYLRGKRGAYRDARRYLRLALAIREQLLPTAHASTAVTLNHLGEVLHWMGDFQSALSCHQRALEMRQRLFGETYVDVAETLTNFGRVFYAMGDMAQARVYQERAFAMHNAVGSIQGYDAAFTWDELGRLLCDVGEYDQAQRYAKQALAIWERIGGPQHPERILPLKNLALVLLAKGDVMGARRAIDEAIRLCCGRLGDQHPWMAEVLRVLAEVKRHQPDEYDAGTGD